MFIDRKKLLSVELLIVNQTNGEKRMTKKVEFVVVRLF